MTRSRFATIKWVGGEDDGKITVGVPVECILRFNYEEFLSENFDPDMSYAVQWRIGTKKPPGGWPLYDGVILYVATTVLALERKSANYVYPKSPRIPPPGAETSRVSSTLPGTSRDQRTSETPINAEKSKKSKNNSGKRSRSYSTRGDSSEDEESRTLRGQQKNRIEDSSEDTDDEDDLETPTRPAPNRNRARSPIGQVPAAGGLGDDVQHANPINRIPDNVQNVVEPVQVILDNQRLDRLLELEGLLRDNLQHLQRQQPQEVDVDMVELGRKGSGVRVPMRQWNLAKESRTFTAMATNLVLAIFEPAVLLISNVKGGASKIKKPEENPPRHSQLDADILDAIAESVRKEFPTTFKTTEMNRAINVKLNKLRALDRKAAATGAAAAAAADAAAAARGPQE